MAKKDCQWTTEKGDAMKKAVVSILVAVLAAAGLVSPSAAQDEPANVVEAVIGASGDPGTFDKDRLDFDILREAVIALDLVDALVAADGITVFGPRDSAFRTLARELGCSHCNERRTFEFIANNVPADVLTSVLLYHVSPRQLTIANVKGRKFVPTLLGVPIRKHRNVVTLPDYEPDLRNAIMTGVQVQTGNGNIIALNRVMLPADL